MYDDVPTNSNNTFDLLTSVHVIIYTIQIYILTQRPRLSMQKHKTMKGMHQTQQTMIPPKQSINKW